MRNLLRRKRRVPQPQPAGGTVRALPRGAITSACGVLLSVAMVRDSDVLRPLTDRRMFASQCSACVAGPVLCCSLADPTHRHECCVLACDSLSVFHGTVDVKLLSTPQCYSRQVLSSLDQAFKDMADATDKKVRAECQRQKDAMARDLAESRRKEATLQRQHTQLTAELQDERTATVTLKEDKAQLTANWDEELKTSARLRRQRKQLTADLDEARKTSAALREQHGQVSAELDEARKTVVAEKESAAQLLELTLDLRRAASKYVQATDEQQRLQAASAQRCANQRPP